MLALSATYPESLARHLMSYMRNPTHVRMNALDPALLGQYFRTRCHLSETVPLVHAFKNYPPMLGHRQADWWKTSL